ncbi:MAG: hypothetical protein SGPRY_008074, partial [Prymnesium sp.]
MALRLLLVCLLASLARGALRGWEALRQAQRERGASRAAFSFASALAGYALASRATTTYQPGKMAYFRVRKPLFSGSQRASIAAVSAAGGFGLDRAVGVVDRPNLVGQGFRGVGRAIVRASDGLRSPWEKSKKKRERAERR